MSDITAEPTLESAEDIHASVSEHYAARARNVSSSCCGPASPNVSFASSAEDSCCSSSKVAGYAFYDEEEVAGLPEDAIQGSFGCGNPTALASLKPGEIVVDLGSGGGIDVFMAARQVGDKGFVYGIDMTDDMLALARRNAQQMGVINVEFRKGHIENIPLEDQTADVIISNCVINLSPDKAQVFREAFRVLKPGGRLAISDVVATAPIPEEARQDLALLSGCMSGASPIDDLMRMLEDAGFEAVSIRPRDESREFIREWAPGSRMEDLVVSAAIEARKPAR